MRTPRGATEKEKLFMSTPDAEPWFDAVWRRVCEQLRAEMEENYYAYWIGSLKVVSAAPEAIVICCRSPGRRDQTIDKFGVRIADLISASVPDLGKVDFVFDPVVEAATPPTPPKPPNTPKAASAGKAAAEPANERRFLIEDVKRRVAEHYKMNVNDLESPSRKRALVRARQVAMLMSRRLTGRSFPEIARRFGDRDHSTVIHGCRQIVRKLALDAMLAADVETLMRGFSDLRDKDDAGGDAKD
jgi:chromosomal replication initiation ATPase DnaA